MGGPEVRKGRMETDELIHFDRYGGIEVGTVRGTEKLDAANVEAFGQALAAFIQHHPDGHLLLNLHHVTYLSSAVLSEMLKAGKELEGGGGSLRVCALHDYVRTVFEVTNLDSLFRPMESVREAAEAYNEWLEQRGAP